MDAELHAVGERIRSLMPLGMSQRSLADKSGMTPDALSRALNGQRGFSSTELARIADQLGADVYWLITGKPDPWKVDIAARHQWDSGQNKRANPGRASDDATLNRVIAAYQAAFPDGPPPSKPLAKSPQRLRAQLGENFVRDFAAAVESELGIDVLRVAGLTTDYSLRIGPRAIVLLATTPSWFRSNWSLAHEIGHLALGHHDGYSSTDKKNEIPADQFAANLLLPSSLMASLDWDQMDESRLAALLWTTGVSTMALRNRLKSLKLKISPTVTQSLAVSTPKLIRSYARDVTIGGEVEVTLREQQASTRLFPSLLVDALHQQVEAGEASPELLAWALDVPVDEVDFPEPSDEAFADAHAKTLEDRPSAADLQHWLATNGSR
ncbi:MAG: ImmA/IrrE family metallo-endopeptidase [Mycolicibacterium rufum]|nr:ImmA/IrrE family metallo-endopeptidase [Mycolicibacterium rufum]